MTIELDITGRRVLVVGLGRVGRRKVEGLLAAGACVVGVDPIASWQAPPEITILAERYRAEHLAGVALAFAAATLEVNRQVVADAKSSGIWVNSASEPDSGDFAIPASWHDGPITLSVSTSGASPALAVALRDQAALALGHAPGILATILAELRAEAFLKIPDPDRRRQILSSWDDPKWLKLAQTSDPESLRAKLGECFS
jgi:precorrin-2 dehydrogenase/sirohydrochlorin ferrochelatase